MAVYDLEEQQKIDDLKAWWAQYGKYVSAAVVGVCLVVIGIQGWRWHQRSQGDAAATLYTAVTTAAQKKDVAQVNDATTQLTSRYAGTAYAPRAALLAARVLFDANDRAAAKSRLAWVIEHAEEDDLKQLARYRLAQVLFDEGGFDEALRMLDAKHDEGYAALYADLRGDLLLAAGKRAEAKAAYATTLEKLDARSPLRGLVQVKHDAIGAVQ